MPLMIFRIEKRAGVRVSAERLWDVIVDLPSWDRWNPIETGVEGRIGYGGALTLTETIPGLPARQATLSVLEWQPGGQLVLGEKRGWLFNATRYFRIEQLEPESCIVANGFVFSGFRGEGFHDKHRPAIRAACDAVAEALRMEAEAG